MKRSTPTTEEVSSGVEITMSSEMIDGQCLDTLITIDGDFCIAGSDREKFKAEIGALIDRYRI